MQEVTQEDFKTLVKEHDVIGIAALTISNLPGDLLQCLVDQYDEMKSPKNLTFILANDITSMGLAPDLNTFVKRKMVSRLIMSIMTLTKDNTTSKAIKENEIEAYFLPQGVIATHYRQTNAIIPGVITKIGLNTYVDPRYQGGQINAVTKTPLVSFLNLDGEDYLHYQLPKLDIALIRGTYADTHGNIYMTHEAYLNESYGLALNAHANHGTVIVQVKAIVDETQVNPSDVFIPGALVDYVYINQNKAHHRQVIQSDYEPSLSGEQKLPEVLDAPLPLSPRKLILRRVAQLLRAGDTISIGYGINNELANVLHEEQVLDDVEPILDIGIFGGFISSGDRFGMNYNFNARMRHEQTWDFIYNGGISVACLSFAEVDQQGNVNVSFFNGRMNGCGGFIDISQSVKRIIFSGSLVAYGQLIVADEQLIVEQEGTTQKFIPKVQNIDFNAAYAKSLNQEVFYVTDRAVFELREAGLTLIEVAPGLDIDKDIIHQMGFKPIIAEDLKVTDHTLYREKWGLLAQSIHSSY